MRPHRSLCNTLARLLRRSGAHVDLERAVPELYLVEAEGEKITEAILDVSSSYPGGLHKFLVDVTIKAPHADRYKDTDRVAGVAAQVGEREKSERYGLDVLPLSFEPYGRMGVNSACALRTLALNAATFYNSAHGETPRRLYSKWRAALERTLAFEIADVVLLSLGHSSGVHALRSRRR